MFTGPDGIRSQREHYRAVTVGGFAFFLFFTTTAAVVVGADVAAVVPSTWGTSSSGSGGTGRPPPSSGFSNATPWVPMRTQLKSTANTGSFSVCASMLRHTCTLRPTKYTLLNFRHTRLRVQAGGNIGTQIGRGFLPTIIIIMFNKVFNVIVSVLVT